MTDSLPSGRAPIFLMSFNRPDYLQQVLKSLCAQVECEIDKRTIILFQDGAVNPYSNERHASEDDISECVRIFYSLFPNGQVFRSPINLGVALNFDRAERYGFEELSAESVVFLEDDLVLSGHYLSIVDRLTERFAEDNRVGYVAAYGDHTKSIKAQHTHRRRLIGLTHNWGFALYRRQWLRMRPYVLQYLRVVEGTDYRHKDAKAIRDLFASWGFGCPAISQDAAKTIACCIDGVIKINTYGCNAKYIGSQGLHMNDKLYAERGYHKTELYPEAVMNFAPFDAAVYDTLLRDQQAWAGEPATTVTESVSVPMTNDQKSPLLKVMGMPQHDPNQNEIKASGGMASQLSLKLFGENVFTGYEPKLMRDLQGWNSNHPIFRECVSMCRPTIIFDVGVWKGGSTVTLANLLRDLVIDGAVIAIDTFLGSPEHWKRDRQDGMFASLRLKYGYPNLYWQFLSNIKHCRCEDYVVPLAQTTENAAVILKHHNVEADLIHLDAAHEYGAVLRDALSYWDLLKPGGIFIGDDYHDSWPGVVRAANELADRLAVKLEIHKPKWIVRKPM
jgi:Methyltransferase domain/Glycosyl transferase family 2